MIRIHGKRRKAEIAGDDFRGEIGYDYLVIALGRRLATERVPGFFENAQHLLGVKAALNFGKLVRTFREGTIIVGLCPGGRLPVPVCETAFALARKFEPQMRDGKVQIKVIFPDSLKGAFGGANLHTELEAAFEKHGIHVLYDVPIKEIAFNEVISSNKHNIKCDLLMLVPPFSGNASLRDLGVTDEEYFVKVDDSMRVKGLKNTYAVGDMSHFPDPSWPTWPYGKPGTKLALLSSAMFSAAACRALLTECLRPASGRQRSTNSRKESMACWSDCWKARLR